MLGAHEDVSEGDGDGELVVERGGAGRGRGRRRVGWGGVVSARRQVSMHEFLASCLYVQ